MSLDQIKQLGDDELAQIAKLAETELRSRADKRRQEAITKIRELASSVGVTINIGGLRGRPSKRNAVRQANA
jgi:hypothetical protein